MKKNFSKIIIIAVIIIIVICICIGIIFMMNNNKSSGGKTENKQTQDLSTKSVYDGTIELGTKVEFTINEIELPEKANPYHSCEIDGNKWRYDLDSEDNAININVTADGNISSDFVIPNELDGHKIISIGTGVPSDSSFFNKTYSGGRYWENITSITVPEGVKYINDNAFYGCDNLEKITLPDSIIYIGNTAFGACHNLSSINSDIEGKVVMPKNLQYYGKSLFRYNKKIRSFEFPEQIDYIQDYTFYETDGISDLTISKQFKYIGEGAFSQASIENLTIEDGVEIIGNSAFTMNSSLLAVDLPKSVISIERNAFNLCRRLEKFNYEGKLKYIGTNVFDNTRVKDCLKENQLPKT